MSRSPLQPFLAERGFIVLDGGLATALESRGHALDSPLWSAELVIRVPEEVSAVHTEYLEAGADCIATVSYQASFEGFRSLGMSVAESEDLLELSVELALDARDEFWSDPANRRGRIRPLVAASLGPYGAYLADGSEYDGRYGIGADELDAFHRRRFEVFAGSGADLVACETIPSSLEAEVLLGILDDLHDTWAWLSFSCRDGRHVSDGTPFADVVRACDGHDRIAAIGVNCTAPSHVAELIRGASSLTGTPLVAYPNSGELYDAESKTWFGSGSGGAWLAGVDDWAEAGAVGLGGCCRVGADTIRALRTWVVERSAEPRDSS